MTASVEKIRPDLVKRFEDAAPMERVGNRRDLKLAVISLLSDGGAFTTGADISVTGGLHLGKI